jgi:23S rRNA U2552 (ribose-2'-O)-methylase RlmE/FtsJ
LVGIDIQTCAACGGAVRIIACIEDPQVIEKILAHLDKKTTDSPGWRGRRKP